MRLKLGHETTTWSKEKYNVIEFMKQGKPRIAKKKKITGTNLYQIQWVLRIEKWITIVHTPQNKQFQGAAAWPWYV